MFESTPSHAAMPALASNLQRAVSSRERVKSSRSQRQCDSTVTAYAKDVRQFVETYGGTIPCDADALIAYMKLMARRVAPATHCRRIMAIQDAHTQKGLTPPTADPRIREALRLLASGVPPTNLLGDAKVAAFPAHKRQGRARGAAPITRALLTRTLDAMGTGMRSLDRRDTAIFLLGFIAGLKRGAICALNIEDITFTPDAMLVRIKGAVGGKDSETRRNIAVPCTGGPLCAATAVRRWIAHNALEGASGPLFPRFTRSGEPVLSERLDSAYVSALLKKRLRDAGVDDVSLFSGESLCRGHQLESTGRSRT